MTPECARPGVRGLGPVIRRVAGRDSQAGDLRPPSVEVALATFNSCRYLPELLDSLFVQTCQQFTLLISDDGSSDSTLNIIARYRRRHPGRIRLVASPDRLGGPLANFSHLMNHLTADYVLFCDHDDVWLPDKIALSLVRMRALETRHGASTPLLLHTDLTVVGPDLEVLGSSSFRYQRIDPTRNSLHALLLVNTASGCATIVNRALYQRARPVPAAALMHDHWMVLIAASVGRICCLRESTVLYRQHDHNAIGATRWGAASILDRIRQTLFGDGKRRTLERYSPQAEALLARCGDDMTSEQYRATAALARLWTVNRWLRFYHLWRHRLLLNGLVRNVALFIAVTRRARRPEIRPLPAREAGATR